MTKDVSTEKEVPEKKAIWNPEPRILQKQEKFKQLSYSRICGEITVDSPTGEAEKKDCAKVFYTAYLSKKIRPLIFLFNGGPGGGSVWLHLGAFGPKRVHGLDAKFAGDAKLVDNAETLLKDADLVFVDPVGTGLSTAKEECFKDFCTEKADAKYLAQFISRFLSQHKLWGRHLYLCGESYGGYRVCLLGYELLVKHDVQCAGLILVAPFISGIGIQDSAPNIIGEANYICGYALSAWYHKRSSLNKTCSDEKSAYKKAKAFAFEKYIPARLLKHPHEIEESLVKELSGICGVPTDVVKKEGLNILVFCNNLFSGIKQYPGRLDSRYLMEHPFSLSPYIDSSLVALGTKLSPLMNAYLFNEVGWDAKERYLALSHKVNEAWRFEEPFYDAAFSSLRALLKLQPKMRVYAAGGYYDLACPLLGVEFDLVQVADTEHLRKRIHIEAFVAGHMMYVHDESRKKLTASISSFLSKA